MNLPLSDFHYTQKALYSNMIFKLLSSILIVGVSSQYVLNELENFHNPIPRNRIGGTNIYHKKFENLNAKEQNLDECARLTKQLNGKSFEFWVGDCYVNAEHMATQTLTESPRYSYYEVKKEPYVPEAPTAANIGFLRSTNPCNSYGLSNQRSRRASGDACPLPPKVKSDGAETLFSAGFNDIFNNPNLEHCPPNVFACQYSVPSSTNAVAFSISTLKWDEFATFRNKFLGMLNFDNIAKEFKETTEQYNPAASGAQLFVSVNQTYILKSMTQTELEILVTAFLKDDSYFEHMYGGYSTLAPIIGKYGITTSTYQKDFYMMKSVFPRTPPTPPKALWDRYPRAVKWDLKGAVVNRWQEDDDDDKERYIENKRDLDFLVYFGSSLKLSGDQFDKLEAAISRDVEWLASKEIIDYSLLVFSNVTQGHLLNDPSRPANVYFVRHPQTNELYELWLGTSDLLATYNFFKAAEFVLKKVKRGLFSDSAVVNPTAYATRFKNRLLCLNDDPYVPQSSDKHKFASFRGPKCLFQRDETKTINSL